MITEEKYPYRRFFFRDHGRCIGGHAPEWLVRLEGASDLGPGAGGCRVGDGCGPGGYAPDGRGAPMVCGVSGTVTGARSGSGPGLDAFAVGYGGGFRAAGGA